MPSDMYPPSLLAALPFWPRAWRRLRPSCFFFVLSLISIASLAGLASLAADVLVDVADALALVRLGLAPRTDVGGHLADELLVDAVDLDAGRLGHRELDAVRRVDHHRVREPEGQLDLVLALRGGPVADADDVELLAEPLGDARDHVGDQRADEPVHRAGAPGVVLALDED